MRATNFEFRHRFWFIAAVFWIAFSLYWLDPVNVKDPLARWLRWDGLSGAGNQSLILWLAVACAVGAVLIRVWATAYLRADVMRDHALHTERLVADGPYRHVRNPLYIGTNLIAWSMAPLASRAGAPVLIVLMFLFTLRLILREEAELRPARGESYARFLETVPRLIPSLLARASASGARPQWAQALRGEGFVIAFACAVIGIAITRNLTVFWVLIAAGFVLAGLSRFMLSRGQSRAAAGPGGE